MVPPEHMDVLIVGAGLSGIGAGYHLQTKCPGKSYAILEARGGIGGTWDLFRFPGVRSDSDMFTLGYSFRPWRETRAIADGQSILSYVRQTARQYGIDRKIRFHHRVVRADWSTDDARWTVEAIRTDTGEPVTCTCSFLLLCSGYYRYDEGYTPKFEGTERFSGEIVHPQKWPEDIDYTGKRVVVIGSGATAVTTVPAMAQRAAHVTMLQRSPSYVFPLPVEDSLARFLRHRAPANLAYWMVRWKNVLWALFNFQFGRRLPTMAKAVIRRELEKALPPGYDIDTHFTPSYNPWDQRVCVMPEGDLLAAIAEGRASIVTDRIDTFTESGLKLESGRELEADIIVTATGLNMLALGGVRFSVDGSELDLAKTVTYKGMMLSGVPNLALTFGYTNASWTLKCELTCAYVCRLLNHMDEHGYGECRPSQPGRDIEHQPFIDFSSGYIVRSIGNFPRQGSRAPWRQYQNYALDILSLRFGGVEDGTMRFFRASPAPAETVTPAATRAAA